MSSPDFGLKSLEISEKANAEYVFYAIKGEPVFEIAPALETNRGYYDAILRRTKKNIHRIRTGSMSASQISEQRDEDRQLFSKYVVKGWKDVKDTAGNAVPFTQSNVLAFLNQLPDWLFDELRTWAGNAANFLKQDEMTDEEVAEVGEHLESD